MIRNKRIVDMKELSSISLLKTIFLQTCLPRKALAVFNICFLLKLQDLLRLD